MSSVIKVPVVGNVKQEFVYAGAALIAGMVGYAWWTSRGGGAEVPAVMLPAAETDFTPPTVVDGNINVGDKPTTVPGAAQSNTEWVIQATDIGAALGYDGQALKLALQKYLGKQPLSISEAALVTAVVAVIGVPPQNGPFALTPSLPTNPNPGHDGDDLPAPTGFNPVGISPTQIALQWNRVPGAISYEIRADNGPWHNAGPVEKWIVPAQPDYKPHTYQVRAVGSHGKRGAVATGTAATITQEQVNINLGHLVGR